MLCIKSACHGLITYILPMKILHLPWLKIFKKSFSRFRKSNPLILASSTAFFTLFSLAPIVLLIVNLFGVFFADKLVKSEAFHKISTNLGEKTASAVQSILNNIQSFTNGWVQSILLFALLIFISTTLLMVVQTSINEIWDIRQKTDHHWKSIIKDRLISFLIILLSGLLILISFFAQTALNFLNKKLSIILPDVNFATVQVLNEGLSLLLVVIWFSLIYKLLPGGKIPWRSVFIGSFITGIAFSLGRFLIIQLLAGSNITNIYGASGSIILLLLFVFYSSLIFYLGAAFTKVITEAMGFKVKTRPYTVKVKLVQLD
jgi:membrane protein